MSTSASISLTSIGLDTTKIDADVDPTTLLDAATKQAQAQQKVMWMFIAIVVIALIVLFYIAKESQDWYTSLTMYSWGKSTNVLAIIMCAVIALAGYATYTAYIAAPEAARMLILMSFVGSLVLLAVWFAIFYRAKDLTNSLYLGFGFLFMSFVHTYLVWQSDKKAGYAMLPYAVWALGSVALCWNIKSQQAVANY